MQQSFDIVHL